MVLLLKILLRGLDGPKWRSMRARNLRPMLVVTELHHGGLYQMMLFLLRLLLLLDASPPVSTSEYSRMWSCPLLNKASCYGLFAALNISLLEELAFRRWLMPLPIALVTDGGWLDFNFN